jgi:hypothetical protein
VAEMLRPPGRSQRQILYRTEKSILADDPSLGSLFAIFTRLTLQDTMPWAEQARPRQWPWRRQWRGQWQWRRQWRKLALGAGLIAFVTALVFVSLAHSPPTCGAARPLAQHHSVTRAASCLPSPVVLRDRP